MADEIQASQAQAVEQSPAETATSQPALNVGDVMDQLTTARTSFATTEEISRLEGLLAEAQKPAVVKPEKKQEAAPVETLAVAEVAPVVEDETDETETPATKRMRVANPLDQAFITLRKTGMSAEEAHERIYGGQKPVQAPVSTVPPEITDAQNAVDELERKMDEAGLAEGLWNADIANLTKQHARAVAALESAKIESSLNSRDMADVREARNASLAQAVTDYPSLKNKESVHWRLAAQLAREASDPTHPNHARSTALNAPEFFANEAARLLNLKPASASVVAPAPSPVSQQQLVSPAPGFRQTSPPQPQPSERDILAASEARAIAATEGRFVEAQPSRKLSVLIR